MRALAVEDDPRIAEDLHTARRHALLKAHGMDVPVSLEG